ncbi:hypothetical protein V5T82_02490 [Magnetovibrio sp. PR-2]|uniref:hypothetical protein n=1 Tax=Magnetovibrio sp. PR-2 TaxID=3120356 RepID=UPI002FCE0DCB
MQLLRGKADSDNSSSKPESGDVKSHVKTAERTFTIMETLDRYRRTFSSILMRMHSYHIRSGSYVFSNKEDAQEALQTISTIRDAIQSNSNVFLALSKMGATQSDIVYLISELMKRANEEIVIFDDNLSNSMNERPYFASPLIIDAALSASQKNVPIDIYLKNEPDGGADRNMLLLALANSSANHMSSTIKLRDISRCKCRFILVDSKSYLVNVDGKMFANVNDPEYGEELASYAQELSLISDTKKLSA